MAIALLVDSLDSVDESIKNFYTQTDDGKYRLDLDGYEDPKGLKSALEKERQAAKEASKAVKELQEKYKGIDPDKVKSLLSKLENDEEAKLLAEGKIDEVVNKRIEKQRAELERQVKDALTKSEQAELRAKNFEQQVLDNAIRAAAAKAGLHQHAIEDALFRARTMFQLDENGNAIQIDSDGESVVLGKDGKSPYNPLEWLEEMKEKAPHWYPASNSGGGSGGNTGTGSKHNTRTRSQFEAMSQFERMQFSRDGGRVVDT